MTTPCKGHNSSPESLSISASATSKTSKTHPVADTWEEAVYTSESSNDSPPSTPFDSNPGPPPPTPISPKSSHSRNQNTDWSSFPAAYPFASFSSTPRSPTGPDKRPEKSSAAAERIIAGALGVKAPEKSEKARAYERAVREKERKRKNQAKKDAAMAVKVREEAGRAFWED